MTQLTQVLFKGKPIHLSGHLPAMHAKVPDFRLVDKDLNDKTLKDFAGKRKIVTTVPSLDTGVCSSMTKHFNDLAKKKAGILIITVSADLPFAQKRFCDSEGVQNVLILSMMRDKEFGKAWGLLMQDGPLAGLLARSVWVLDEHDKVLYCELVKEITTEPDYTKVVEVLEKK